MLGELWIAPTSSGEVEREWPRHRICFFRRHGLRRRPGAAGRGARPAHGPGPVAPVPGLDLRDQLATLREAVRPDAREDYFLARMTFRHLRPGDETSLISLERGDHLTGRGGGRAHRRERGALLRARRPLAAARSPACSSSSASRRWRSAFEPEHRHLIAVDAHDAVIGGVF